MTMPNVPSAPMNSFVMSNPADDLRERCRVLITSPFGKTTVCTTFRNTIYARLALLVRTAFRNHSLLAVPYRTALAEPLDIRRGHGT